MAKKATVVSHETPAKRSRKKAVQPVVPETVATSGGVLSGTPPVLVTPAAPAVLPPAVPQTQTKGTASGGQVERGPQHPLNLVARLADLDIETLSVVDMGAGRMASPISQQIAQTPFRLLVSVDGYEPNVQALRRAVVAAKQHEVFWEDMRHYVTLYQEKVFDVALFLDTVEHLPKAEAVELLMRMEQLVKKRILIWLPLGECPQGALSGNELEIHQSTWTAGDLQALGYYVEVFPGFHRHVFPDRGVDAAWAVKNLET